MHGGGNTGGDEPMADMNMIPLIDIALTLVIILMVTSAFINKSGVALTLPKTVTQEGAPEQKKDLVITVSANGFYYMDEQPRDENYVKQRLLEAAKQDKDSRVLVKGDKNVPYFRIMSVMDMARVAGLTKVTLPTDPMEKPK